MHGVFRYVSHPNNGQKKLLLLLFINRKFLSSLLIQQISLMHTDRLVECPSIKKMIDTIYAQFLPKGHHPFIYLSLEIKPENMDVNVHPTKREVHFLHEEKIVALLGEEIYQCLSAAGTSRQFSVPVLKTTESSLVVVQGKENTMGKKQRSDDQVEQKSVSTSAKTETPRYEYKLVRTDSQSTTLDKFVQRNTSAGEKSADTPRNPLLKLKPSDSVGNQTEGSNKPESERAPTTRQADRPWIDVRLSSILQLRKQVKREAHACKCFDSSLHWPCFHSE